MANEVIEWVEKNPVPAFVVGGVVVLGVMWFMGVFSSPAASSNGGQTNMAAAYYAAEAAQAQAGAQIQLATVQATNQTAQVTANANAAEAIAATEANMQTTLGGQTLTGQQTLYNDELLSAQTSANDAVQSSNINAANTLAVTNSNNWANEFLAALNGVIPQEVAQTGAASVTLPGLGNFQVGPTAGAPNINQAIAAGYTPAQALALYGF
jgi:hypothetical protein